MIRSFRDGLQTFTDIFPVQEETSDVVHVHGQQGIGAELLLSHKAHRGLGQGLQDDDIEVASVVAYK